MEENEVANTVNARDYKGFCNEKMTGVAHLRIPIREAVKSGYREARVGGKTASTSQQSEVTQDEGG